MILAWASPFNEQGSILNTERAKVPSTERSMQWTNNIIIIPYIIQ